MIEIARTYNQNGFAVHPVKTNKAPLMATAWNNGFPPEDFNGAAGVGVICGKISGGLECIDFDNHFGDAEKILIEYLAISEVKEIYKKYKLPIQSTQRGGFHLLFRCTKNEGNKKLAQRGNSSGKPEAIIETRGEGGYFCAYPTPGYKVIRNNIFEIQVITPAERAILIDNALSFNEFYPKIIATEFEKGDRPGDEYNNSFNAISDMKALLESEGWRQLDNYKWRRPGKEEGISATLGKVAENVFYVFTSNGYPFEPNKAYTPFQVLGLLKFNGDFGAAAKSLVNGHSKETGTTKRQEQDKKEEPAELEKILNASRIDVTKHIERPPTILSIKEASGTSSILKRVFTLGNFSCIIGKAKSKKTYLVSLFTASLLRKDFITKLYGELPEGKKTILYFDTEQGEYDSLNVIKRIDYMAGTLNGLYAFNLRSFSPKERCQVIEYAFQVYGANVGFCVIDGVADLAVGINDEEEATRVTTMLLRISKEYNCHVTTVLHQNKNDNFATGHIGSAVMKKAEIVISVTKSKEQPNASDISNEMSRGVDFEPFQMVINSEGYPEISGATVKRPEYKPEFETADWPAEPPF